MRAVIQKVSQARVTIQQKTKAEIKQGLLVFVGIEDADTKEDIQWLSNKIVNLRIFNDDKDVLNFSVKDTEGDILVISQFTLLASTKKGNRPSYLRASKAGIAIPLYEQFIIHLVKDFGKTIFTGEFGADMQVELINDGPVTIVVDTKVRE